MSMYIIMKKILILINTLLLLISCVGQEEHNAVVNELEKATKTIDSLTIINAEYRSQIDELLNGRDRLIGQYNSFVSSNKFIKAEEIYQTLIARHPDADKDIKDIYSTRKRAQEQRDSINKVQRDSIRLANINNLGDWKIGDYVDDFGDPTGEHYVYQNIIGSFSNSATSNSSLKVFVKVYRFQDRIHVDFKYDEYCNGTIDDTYCYKQKFVCHNLRKVFEDYGIDSYIEKGLERNEANAIKDIDMLLLEDTFEATCIEDKTKYYFTINTKYLENALIKAGILKL